MARFVSSLLFALALIVVPALCSGGLLEHECDCGSEVEMECQHEDSCAEDPCATLATQPDDETRVEFVLEASPVPVIVYEWNRDPSSVGRPPELRPPPPDRMSLPYAESDRPRLL